MAVNVIPIALNTFREAIRNKILYSVLLFAAVLMGAATFYGSVSIGSEEKVIKDFGLFCLSFFGAIITMLSGVSLLNKELKQKTVYHILSKPVKRWEFIVGKHLGLTLTVNVLISLMGAGLVAFAACFERKIDWLLFQGVLFAQLEITVVAALTIFFSAMVITTTLSGIFTFGTYIAGKSISYFSYFFTQGDEYGAAITTVIRILDWILPDLSLFGVNNLLVYGVPATAEQFCAAFFYCLGYTCIILCLAVLIFQRREFM